MFLADVKMQRQILWYWVGLTFVTRPGANVTRTEASTSAESGRKISERITCLTLHRTFTIDWMRIYR